MMTRIIRLIVCVVALAAAGACEESSVVPPTSPTRLPSDKVAQLTIACPANVTAQSLNGVSATVSFPPARANGGLAPVQSGCTPPSGSAFAVGASTVRCNASDELQQTASCSFTVRVLPPPQIAATRFLAFGDSLTAGVIAPPLNVPVTLAFTSPSQSYPTVLRNALQSAYPVQSISMINSGLPGEEAADAFPRFQADLLRINPDVVLIMEGTNDVNAVGKATSPSQNAARAAAAIEAMVVEAQGRIVDPFLATIPPLRPLFGNEERVAAVFELNGIIRSIASARGVPLVDVFTIVNTGSCPASSGVPIPCLGDDGIHPTAAANELIAEAFFDRIVDIYDVDVTAASVTDVDGGVAPAGTDEDTP